MKKHYLLGGGLTILASFMLAACNSNDDDNVALKQVGGGSGAVTTPTKATVTVTPSLGKILNAKVVLKNAKTGATLGSGTTGNTGIATFDATKTTDPVIVEVQGQANSKYFDESKKTELDFATGQTIRVALPTFTNSIGVSTLTEIAYQAAIKKAGTTSALTAAIVNAANDSIRKALAPELASITTAATLVGSTADLSILTNTEAGKYALKLAALAELAKTQTTPALAILNQLAADITTDDKLDGVATGKEITFTYNNSNLVSQITTNLNSIITTANLSSVGFNVSSFNPVLGNITITVGGTGGGAGSDQNCLLTANYNVQGIPFTYKVCYSNFPENAVCSNANQAFSNVSIPAAAGVTANWSFSQAATCPADAISVNYVN